jgi:hypothetical protein
MPTTRCAARALLSSAFLAALIFNSGAHAQEPEVPQRPQGPAAGPVIKLPRGMQTEVERPTSREAYAAQPGTPRKWEYCAITGFVMKQQGFSLSSPRRPWAAIRYFSGGYEEVEGGDEETALANAFAKLGEEGWELTGVRTSFRLDDGSGDTRHAYFFKRPKPVE